MEIQITLLLAVLSAILCLGASMNIPANENRIDSPVEQEKVVNERATWLHTRQLEEEFKQLVGMAITELVNEGTLNSNMMAPEAQNAVVEKTKRGRWQGFCFRRTNSGRFLPYICWKGENDKK